MLNFEGSRETRAPQRPWSEASGGVALHTLQRAAEALGRRLVYAIVPERPLADTVRERAEAIAERQSQAVEHNMRLENQAVHDKKAAQDLRRQLAEDLLRRPARLWDEK